MNQQSNPFYPSWIINRGKYSSNLPISRCAGNFCAHVQSAAIVVTVAHRIPWRKHDKHDYEISNYPSFYLIYVTHADVLLAFLKFRNAYKSLQSHLRSRHFLGTHIHNRLTVSLFLQVVSLQLARRLTILEAWNKMH
ncbi:hypothetical protein Y032_0169g210 [Ancylostoma ceylanicum]|uniref:Uncharacterized protein n=1 Tax=Ancylostoma ceylanicum TaxID=53326 RepID=A0A016SV93_9BILA|nr:hypothetical protein Y032_0169g210 [Ancylostoma ceylanicum]